MDPKRRLSNIDVLYISLVDKGANMKKIVFKSDNLPEDPPISKIVEILKTDVDKKMVYGIVYSPEETDSQGDIASAEEIEKAAYGFMKYRRSGKIDKMHNMEPEEGFTAESWITRENDALFKDDSPEGSWAVGIKIEKAETWGEVKDKKLTSLSLMGSANTEQLEKSESDNFWKLLKKKLGIEDVDKAGRVISTLNTKKIQDAINALNNLLESAKVEKTEESEMTDEEIKTGIDDGLKDGFAEGLKKVSDDLKKEFNDKFDKVFNEIKDTVAKHETTFAHLEKSKGSTQQKGQETDDKEAAELAKRGQYKDKEGKVRTHVFA
ncbi:hypothetical protein KA005_43080 [bacterium]|nr:hypothetical protein [bacterium]